MNDAELIEFVRLAGRYEVFSDGEGHYTSLPIPAAAILVTPESHRECFELFRTPDE